MQKILIAAHCILNKAAKVEQDETELEEEYKVREKLLKSIVEHDIQVIQLPCPEFMMYGSRRWGHVKDQFDNPYFRKVCREIFAPILLQIEEYCGNKQRFHVMGILSVEGSPSCGRSLTCRGDWGGELSDMGSVSRKVSELQMKEEPGVFMDVIDEMLREKHIALPILTMQETIQRIVEKEKENENK